ncbi:hypothetical protein Tco_0298741 [Tanacetum coccineum]
MTSSLTIDDNHHSRAVRNGYLTKRRKTKSDNRDRGWKSVSSEDEAIDTSSGMALYGTLTMACFKQAELVDSLLDMFRAKVDFKGLEHRVPDQKVFAASKRRKWLGTLNGQLGRRKRMPTFSPLGSDWQKIIRRKRMKKSVEIKERYNFISQAKSRSRVEHRLFEPPGSPPIELGSNRYFTANGGFDVQLELKLLNTPLE